MFEGFPLYETSRHSGSGHLLGLPVSQSVEQRGDSGTPQTPPFPFL